ncbi:hypothetical protein B0H13DRAFT_2333358 [Mycena leptocephala]|nr:hypothetical protein B0H13DRAFT_2333358 [Mycena leptocephala]
MYKIQSMASGLPRVLECLIAFFTGALETWLRFTVDYEEGGTIAILTPEERERAHMPPTNDANEGTLGERRTGSRHAPNMSLHQHNACKMYKRNNTKVYRRQVSCAENIPVVSREGSHSAVDVKHAKDKVKGAKVKAVNAELDKKEPTNKELDLQLAWHRRAEGPLPAGTESLIPKVSKLTAKGLKRDALIAAVGRFVARPAISNDQEDLVDDDQVEDDIDSDVDMESGY